MDEEEKILRQIGEWMAVNKEGIIATRPWKVFGEGPAIKDTAPMRGPGFNEDRSKPLTWQDVRYTVSKDGKSLYAIVMGRPAGEIGLQAVKVLGGGDAAKVSLLGCPATIEYAVDDSGRLNLKWPESVGDRQADEYACVFKLSGFEFEVAEPIEVK